METDNIHHCCEMHRKVAIGIVRVFKESECGIPDSVLAEYHDFSYESRTGLPVAAALATRFCPWCGSSRSFSTGKRTTETVSVEQSELDENQEDC